MPPARLLFKVTFLFLLLHGIVAAAYSQDVSWMKGLWNEYSGSPYAVPPVKCTNTLQITTAIDSSFTGLQTTYFAADTTINITYSCTGLFTKTKAQFSRGDVAYKKNSSKQKYKWKECANSDARTCSLYVEQERIILLVAHTNTDITCTGTIAYYRDLNDFDTLTRQRLVSLYPKPMNTTILASYTSANTNTKAPASQTLTNLPEKDSSGNRGNLPPLLRERTNKLMQTVQITAPYIEVILLDDAEIDGDIISLYYNNEEVISHKTLGREVIKYSFKADAAHTHHELVLVAENLGSIPPNTALMRIRAGDKKYELTTRANMHENAKVIVEYTGN